MKPLKLVMSAFGPYAGEEIIDFEKLGSAGLYLITGDTGSGKTMIFDAVSYALFGESSGNREPSMLRSRFADAGTKTYVQLSFAYKGRRYEIRRNPEYARPKDRGEGETKERADAVLTLASEGKVITGVKNVNDSITELLGINKEQFSQIAMIAQGEFLKLLLSDTKKRSEIFREIFGTGKYQELQDALRSRSGKLHDEYEEISRSIRQYLEGFQCPEDHVRYEEIEKLKSHKEIASAEGVRRLLDEVCNSLRERAKSAEKALQETEREWERISKSLGAYDAQKRTGEQLAKNREKKEALLEKLDVCKEALAGEEKTANQRKKLSEEILLKSENLGEFQALEQLILEYTAKQKALEEAREKIEKEQKEIEALQTKLAKGQEQRRLLANPEANRAAWQSRKERLNQVLAILREYQSDSERIDKLTKNEKKKQTLYMKAADEADALWRDALVLERAFLDGQAGVLAKNLKPGKPCPVCGALEHPEPALCLEDTPGQKEVEGAKERAEAARKEAASYSEEIKGIAAEKKVLEEKREEAAQKLAAAKALLSDAAKTDREDELLSEIAKADEKIKEAEEQIEEAARLDRELPKEKERLEALTLQYQQGREGFAGLKESNDALDRRIREKRQQLGFADKKEAAAYIKNLEKERKQLQKAYDKALEDVTETETKVRETEAAIRTLTASLKKQQKEAGEAKAEELLKKAEELKGEKKRLSSVKSRAEHEAASDEEIKKRVFQQLERMEETGAKWQMVKALHNTASGNVAGRDKIMLETYVQTAYFDRIIARANVHFMKMTDGRFELLRAKEAGNQRSQSGLELNVLDHYHMSRDGGSRSVKSLSGGESFLAALSLALGMSEEVSANAGGIETDALFVDEGFGTLDEAALDRAIRALQELTTANRIVGIISHVPELKNRCERQIVVKRDKLKGSRTELII